MYTKQLCRALIKLIQWRHGSHYAWWKENTAFNSKNLIPMVKYAVLVVWWFGDAFGPGQLALIEGITHSALYQRILQKNVWLYICELWVLQQDTYPKHTIKSTWKWLKSNKFEVLEWPSQSPDLILIEMLWQDFKQAVHAWKPTNVVELKQCCMEEWAKSPPQGRERLNNNYSKSLVGVIATKFGTIS
jgi:hypothetical protein